MRNRSMRRWAVIMMAGSMLAANSEVIRAEEYEGTSFEQDNIQETILLNEQDEDSCGAGLTNRELKKGSNLANLTNTVQDINDIFEDVQEEPDDIDDWYGNADIEMVPQEENLTEENINPDDDLPEKDAECSDVCGDDLTDGSVDEAENDTDEERIDDTDEERIEKTEELPDLTSSDPCESEGMGPAYYVTPQPELTVSLILTNEAEDEEGYRAGEMITYKIVVTNTGNVDCPNILVVDNLAGNQWDVELLPVGADAIFDDIGYTVTDLDAENGSVTSEAIAFGEAIADPINGNDPQVPQGSAALSARTVGSNFSRYEDTEETASKSEPQSIEGRELQNIGKSAAETAAIKNKKTTHQLTVIYQDVEGNILGSSGDMKIKEGETYSIDAPEIEGYKATQKAVTGTMPGRDAKITVFYVSEKSQSHVVAAGTESIGQQVREIEDYETPLGIGMINRSMGDCFE